MSYYRDGFFYDTCALCPDAVCCLEKNRWSFELGYLGVRGLICMECRAKLDAMSDAELAETRIVANVARKLTQ